MRRLSRNLPVIAAALATVFTGCQGTAGPTGDARALLRAAIEAHGGRDRLARFDDFRIVADVQFKGAARMRRTLDYAGADHWAMQLDGPGGRAYRMWIDGVHCWQETRHRVEPCPAGAEENALMGVEDNAWVLRRIDERAVQPADAVRDGPRLLPAIRAADLVLVFDAESHRLVQVRRGEGINVLSDFRNVEGAWIAARRVLTLAGKPDLEETLTEILPGGGDTDALRVPASPADGTVIEGMDAERTLAWMEVDDPVADASGAVQRLDAFVRRHGRNPTCSDGLIWITPDSDGKPSARWRLGVGVEVGAPLASVEEGGLHLDTWPATRVLGIFHRGDIHGVAAQRARLEQVLQTRGHTPAPGTPLQITASRDVLDQPPDQWMLLVSSAVR